MKRSQASPSKPYVPKDELPLTHGKGRVCRVCETRLSQFNPAEVCSLHGGWPAYRMVTDTDDLLELLS